MKSTKVFLMIGKIVGFILLSLLALAAAAFASLMIVYAVSSQRFYIPILLCCFAFLEIYMFLSFFFKQKIPRKFFRRSPLIAAGLVAILIAGYEGYHFFERRVPGVNDQGVDLSQYEPFKEGTKAPWLEGESALSLAGDLPYMDGATALYPVYAAFAQATYPQGDYPSGNLGANTQAGSSPVLCTTTYNAHTNLVDQKADIIFVAGPSTAQIHYAFAQGVTLKFTPIGKEAFVFFVNANNPLESLTVEQVQSIYSGEITNFKDVGGNNQAIRAFQRAKNSGSQTTLEKIMARKELVTPQTKDVIAGMGGIIQVAASYKNYKNALGYSFLFFATEMVQNDQIKLLKINDVYPSKETIRNDEYPFASHFYAVTLEENENPNVDLLLEFILSPQGQELVEKAGYVAIE